MRWYLKVAAFHTLVALPGGRRCYRFAQERLTKGLVPSRNRVQQKAEVGLQYWHWLRQHGETGRLTGGTHLDFGAGWHPTIPLLYYSQGVNKQYLLDVVSLLDNDLASETTHVFREIVSAPDWPGRQEIVRLPEPPPPHEGAWREWLRSLGIDYIAPYRNGDADVLAGQVDVVTCTQVLMHVDRPTMLRCFQMLHRALKPGGLFFATVHLKDLYANADPHITPYNHLKFSPWVWDHLVNSSLMPFNRFKARDYRALLEQAGFSIETFEVEAGTEADRQRLATVRVHACFRDYSSEELAAKHLFFVARKS